MARRPEDRYQSVSELGEALRSLMGPAFDEGKRRLARMVEILTDDRRSLQQRYIDHLLGGLEVEQPARDLFRWSAEEGGPTSLDAEFAAGWREDGDEGEAPSADADEPPDLHEATLVDVWQAVSGVAGDGAALDMAEAGNDS